jgi:hypothetical protein
LSDVIFYGLVAAVLILSLSSLLSLNTALIALSLLAALALILTQKLWFMIDALVFRHTNLIQVLGNQQLSGDRSTAIRQVKGGFIATSMALLKGDARENVDRDKIESIIAHLNYPFRFVLHVKRLDANKLLDKLQTSRSIKEIALSKIGTNGFGAKDAKAGMLKREIEQIEHDIRAITASTPLSLARYIATSARSESRFAAEEHAKSQIRALAGEFSTLLNSNAQILTGTDLLECLEIDSMV